VVREFLCVLALWSPWFRHPVKQEQQAQQWQAGPRDSWKPPLTEADRAFLDFMVRLTPTQGPLLIVKKKWIWEEVRVFLDTLDAGGFVLLQGNMKTILPYQVGVKDADKWFKSHGWLPANFMWRDFHIYKKPMGGMGIHLVEKSA
jgi:hypothetical protein